jgi:hypothetical protein
MTTLKTVIQRLDNLMKLHESAWPGKDEFSVSFTFMEELKQALLQFAWIDIEQETPECLYKDFETDTLRWSEEVLVFRSTRFHIDVFDYLKGCFAGDDGDPESTHTAKYWMKLTEPTP